MKMPKVRLQDQAIYLIFTNQNSISLKTVMHISFVVKGIFPKDLEHMLQGDECLGNNYFGYCFASINIYFGFFCYFDSLSSDVTNTKVRDVQGTDVSQPAEEAGSKNKNCECVNRTLEDQTSNPSEVAEADKECNIENKEKSISSRSKEDSCSNCIPTRDKDEEPEFNSFLYWKTPLPDVDLSSDVLVENLSSDSSNQNELSPIKNDATAPALHITDHDRSGEVALLAKQLSQTSFSDMDLEEEINLNSNVELGNGYEERYKISNQV